MSNILSRRNFFLLLLTTSFFLFSPSSMYAAVPPNDSCSGAIPITISDGGFGLGLFTGTNTDLTEAMLILTCFFSIYSVSVYAAVPSNDSCGGVIPIVIGKYAFGIGTFTSTQDDMTASNMQPGESFSLIASMVKQRITVPKNIFKSINAYYAIN